MTPTSSDVPPDDYALGLADGSHAWYRGAAIKARRYHRLVETLQLLVSAAIPVSAVVWSGDTRLPAVLGGAVVVLTGLRSTFHWHDDYLRFSQAREAVEAQRRLYRTGSEPYDEPLTRGRLLAAAVTRIEQEEMGSWVRIAAPRRGSESEPAS